VITLLSPLIGLSECGHPTPSFPLNELLRELGGAALEARHGECRIDAWTRVEWHGAYLSHQLLPRQQMPALAAGSVFKIQLPDGVQIQPAAMRAAERLSYGLRAEDGYGWISIRAAESLLHDPRFSEDSGCARRPEREPQKAVPGPRYALAKAILSRRLEEQYLAEALRDAGPRLEKGDGTDKLDRVTSHALHRLMSLVEKDWSDLESIKETARRQFESCLVWRHGEPQTLLDYVRDERENDFVRWAADAYRGWELILPEGNPLLDSRDRQQHIKAYRRLYLQALTWQKRNPGGRNGANR
jgi:hypothetical protein